MKHTSTKLHPGAMALAALCIAGTGYVLFEDVIRGGTVNVGHVTGIIALVVTIAAGHMLWDALRARPFAALGLALLFCGGTSYVVITSAGRTAHVMADKQLAAAEQNARHTKAKVDLAKAEAAWSGSKAEAAKECATGKKTRCDGRQLVADKDEAHMRILQVRADALKPVTAHSDYLQAARLFAVIGGGKERDLEAHLALAIPFLLVLICEVGAIVFGNLSFERRPAQQALSFERPVTPKEIEDLKKVLTLSDVERLKSEGMKQHQIAALYGVNQGRVSELSTGKRDKIETQRALH